MRGFEPAFGLMARRCAHAGESRGFAVARLLTHWAEVAGEDLARITRPVKVGYGREGLGATLTAAGAAAPMAPMVEMQKERLRERVNAVYGYNAISRIVLTQTAADRLCRRAGRIRPGARRPRRPPVTRLLAPQAPPDGRGRCRPRPAGCA
jgi:hypothetical protein